MGLITKLQAVNQMLLASGENLVADLENDSGIDTGIALTILDQSSLDFQMRGMANNKNIRKFNPNNNGYIFLPQSDGDEDGLIAAELVSRHYNSDNWLIQSRILNTTSPPKLYNVTDDTDIWQSGDYYIEITMKLPWENLDTAVQRSIMAMAARQYQIITQGDDAADGYLGYNEAVYMAKGRAADINDKKKSIFNSAALREGASYRSRYFSDPTRFRYWQARGI